MDNPYIGPRTFEEKDRDRFFGRDQEAEDLLALVISNRLVLFYAQSGAGKSSLLNTQLIPRLRDEEGFYVLPSGRLNGELTLGLAEPANIFIFNLLLSLDKGQHAAETLLPMTLSDYLQANVTHHEAAWSAATEFDQPFSRVLIIDQFEEIFNTNLHRWSQRQEFFQQLRQAMQVDPLLWVVLAMREDYLASLDPYAFILPNALRTRYSMPRLRYPAALHAVQKPATQAGRPFAEGVAEQLVTNLSLIKVYGQENLFAGEFIDPVHLQIVCYELWNNLTNTNVIFLPEHLKQFGDTTELIEKFYENRIINIVNGPHAKNIDEYKIREWFKKLITPEKTRNLIYRGDKNTEGLPNNTVDLLEKYFLIRGEIRSGGQFYELSHDAFIAPITIANRNYEENLFKTPDIISRFDKLINQNSIYIAFVIWVIFLFYFGTAYPIQISILSFLVFFLVSTIIGLTLGFGFVLLQTTIDFVIYFTRGLQKQLLTVFILHWWKKDLKQTLAIGLVIFIIVYIIIYALRIIQ